MQSPAALDHMIFPRRRRRQQKERWEQAPQGLSLVPVFFFSVFFVQTILFLSLSCSWQRRSVTVTRGVNAYWTTFCLPSGGGAACAERLTRDDVHALESSDLFSGGSPRNASAAA
ncbi:hypothetical protein L596_006125 [Steinernema carpocapsae]|uniref:Transmembrane protein n=1 Tax=Steinernema carpocapsae TaxID=34508 RepID=A0A4U8V1E7_STECR|nr:hypothetical protein L596_006125 [Steinernema carpocapsae]